MAQARLFANVAGEWPILCLDDVASEVDREHLSRILLAMQASAAQILMTGTEEPEAISRLETTLTRFHVEQGKVVRLL
jgi:DNA replication and repair protein RecF